MVRSGNSCCSETICNAAGLYNTMAEANVQCEWGDYTTPPAVFCSCGGSKKYKCPDRPCPGYDLDPGCGAYETPDYCSRNKEFYNCKPTCLSRISQLYGNRALIDPTPAEIETNRPEVIILTKDTTYTREEVESFHFAQAVRSQISYADQFEECRNITARPLLTLSYNKMLTNPILIDKQDIQDVNLALSFSQSGKIGYAHINGRIANSDIQIIKDTFKPTGVSYSYRLTIGSPIKSEKNNKLKLAGEVTISSVKPYGLWVRDEMNASVGLEIADGAKVTINKYGGYNSENRDEGEAIMAYSPIHIGQNAEVKFLKDTRLFRAADNLINSIVIGEGATLETAYLGLNETAVDIRSGAKLSSSDDICMTSLSKTEDHYSRISAYKPGGTLVYKGKTVILNNNSGSNNFAMRMHAYTSGTTGKTQNTWCYSQRDAYAGVNGDVNWARVSTPTPISIPAEGL